MYDTLSIPLAERDWNLPVKGVFGDVYAVAIAA
jgi:hypothetical protein